MAQVRIVTDSAAELDPDVVEELGIAVLPLRVHLRNETLLDSPDLRAASFHEANLAAGVTPSLSAPPVSAFRDMYLSLAGEARTIVSIHTRTIPTNTVKPATEAADSLLGRIRVEVLDCTFMSLAMGFLVEEAARAALRDSDGEEVVRMLRGLIPCTYMGFYVDNLSHVRRSGVLQASPAGSGSTRRPTKPILILEEGVITPQFRVRGKGSPAERLVDFVAEFLNIHRLVLIHSGLMPEVTEIKAGISERLGVESVRDAIYGPATAAVIGPKAVGAVVMER